MNNMKECQPDSDPTIIGGQTIISGIAVELCCNRIAAYVSNPKIYQGLSYISSQLDELMNKSVGVEVILLSGKVCKNTENRPVLAKVIADKVHLYLDNYKLTGAAERITAEGIAAWRQAIAADEQQGKQSKPPQEPSTERELPTELDTEQARKYFARAVNAGLMSEQYKWQISNQNQLGYFCSKVYDNPRPITALESFFEVKNLAASITQAGYEPKRADVKKWRAKQDKEIFFD